MTNDEYIKKELKAKEHAIQIFEKRNSAYRVLYDTVMQTQGVKGKELFKILCNNLKRVCNAKYTAFATYDSYSKKLTLQVLNSPEKNEVVFLEDDNHYTITISDSIVEELKSKPIKICKDHKLCLLHFFNHKFLESLRDKINSCYRISCVRNNCLLAVGVVQLPPESKIKLKDLVNTYLNLASMILQRVQAEEHLLESEARFKQVANSVGECIWETDANGLYTYLSPVVEEILGWTPDEILYKKFFYDLLVPEEKEKKSNLIFDYFDRNKSFKNLVVTIINKNQNKVVLDVTGTPVFDHKNNLMGYRGAAVDITEKQKMEKRLLRADKLESLGTLAGGIAHDFNNMLAGILTSAGLAKLLINDIIHNNNNDDDSSKVYKILDQIEQASVRAKGLTKQLLTFSKGGQPVKNVFDLKVFIKDTVNFTLMGSNVTSRFDIGGDSYLIEGDKDQIGQVISNIVINAKQCMQNGGTLDIVCKKVIITKKTKQNIFPGNYIQISIQDHGPGINESIREKIFDPYFTTKNHGNGLGLTTAYAIIKKHDGIITLESDETGSIFHIFLPVSEKAILATQKTTKQKQITCKGRVLVMDDEFIIRTMLSEVLQKIGCITDLSTDGVQAIEKFKTSLEDGKPYDLIIMDLTIPGGMGGKEAVKKIKKMDTGVKCIVSSGYSEDPVVANYKDYGFDECVCKPYTIKKIHEVVARTLGKS